MTEPSVAEIARGLSEAQRVRLGMHVGSWPERLQSGYPAEIFGPKWCGFAHLSPLGLAVKAHLEQRP